MALRPVNPGLRVMVNRGNDVAKVSLVVPSGDRLEVSDEVAGQLERQGFRAEVAVEPEAPAELEAPAEDAPKGRKAKG